MHYMNVVKKYGSKVAIGSAVLLATPLAMAQTAPDYSAITSAADWSTVATAIISIFAAGALVLVAFVGGKFLLRAIRGA